MKIRRIIPLMFVAFLMISSQVINAQTKNEGAETKASCCKKGGPGDKCCAQGIPDLTDQQKQKIEDLCLAHKKEMTGIKNQLEEKRAHLKTLQGADKADMAAINKTIDEISAFQADMMKKCAATQQSVRELLTEKQRIAFDANPHKCCGGPEGDMREGKKEKCQGQSNPSCTHGLGEGH